MSAPLTTEQRALAATVADMPIKLAQKVAGERGLLPHIDDMLSAAGQQLCIAARAFDRRFGIPFNLFAYIAIERELRGWAPRRSSQLLRCAVSLDPDIYEPPDREHRALTTWSAATWSRVLSVLPPVQREVVELRLLEGLTPAAIAERRGCSRQMVWLSWAKAMKRLREADVAEIPEVRDQLAEEPR